MPGLENHGIAQESRAAGDQKKSAGHGLPLIADGIHQHMPEGIDLSEGKQRQHQNDDTLSYALAHGAFYLHAHSRPFLHMIPLSESIFLAI